ncbi:MAG: nucleoside triphosphate pyrophosphohydrolase [Spirochaetes bacterium]|nr:nucleoside triphosphate pyrophosphohydrolase [Spirochaetota bacterium]
MDLKEKRPLYHLREIAAVLRGEKGCAWDREQDSMSLRPYLIEEAYELYEAIESGDHDHVKEELGDLLYQVYAHAQIASESGLFDIDDVAAGIAEKLVRRHPHVFGDAGTMTAEQVSDNWERIKKKEKTERESLLDGVPPHLPALLRAYRVQQKVSRVGFDWERIDDVVAKIEEELGEFKEAVRGGDTALAAEECGDILFTLVNALRFAKVNPEEALRSATDKFMARFKAVERMAAESGKPLEEMTLQEMDGLWERTKAGE